MKPKDCSIIGDIANLAPLTSLKPLILKNTSISGDIASLLPLVVGNIDLFPKSLNDSYSPTTRISPTMDPDKI